MAEWRRIKGGNGGIITGISLHADGTQACRTDSFGGYTRPNAVDPWVQVLNLTKMPTGDKPWFGGGVDEIIIDPNNSSVIWMLWNVSLYKSVDKGASWSRITTFPTIYVQPHAEVPTKTYGPYIAIDPNNSNVVYVSTTSRGLYRTLDGGTTWAPVTAVSAAMIGKQVVVNDGTIIGSDTTSQTLGLGDKVFNNHVAAFTPVVDPLKLVSVRTAGDNQGFLGAVIAANSTSFTLRVVNWYGNGTYSNWTNIYNNSNHSLPPAISGTDSTSVTVGTGSKTFNNHNTSYSFSVGQNAQVFRTSDPTVQMIGLVTASTSSSFTVNVDTVQGSGTFTDWSVNPPMQADYNIGAGHRISFDTSNGLLSGKTRNIFVHTGGIGTFRSTDGGSTWSLLNTTGAPQIIARMACDPFGVLWAVGAENHYPFSNAYKWDNGWSAVVTPGTTTTGLYNDSPLFGSVAVDRVRSTSKAATIVNYFAGDRSYNRLTTDGGATWNNSGGRPNRSYISNGDVDWLKKYYDDQDNEANGGLGAFFANCDANFDPSGNGVLWVGAEGVWSFIPPVSGAVKITLTQSTKGIEEFIGNNITSLPGDSRAILMGTWDVAGFYSNNFEKYPQTYAGLQGGQYIPGLLRGYSYDYDWNAPNNVYGVVHSGDTQFDFSCKSSNFGRNGSWTALTLPTNTKLGGQIATAGNNVLVFIGNQNEMVPMESTNGGTDWAPISVVGGTPTQYWGAIAPFATYVKALTSDKGNGDIYLYNVNDGTSPAIFKRTKSTGVWTRKAVSFSGESNFNEQLKSTGVTGHMFFTGGFGSYDPGLDPDTAKLFYFTNDGWTTYSAVPGFVTVHAVDYGVVASGQTYPTIYVAGWRSGVFGIWMCVNWNPNDVSAGTWTKLGESYPRNEFQMICDIAGDKGIEAQCYVQTTASGAFYYAADVYLPPVARPLRLRR
jgi:hypothetical protein